jgi:hypothetical protein
VGNRDLRRRKARELDGGGRIQNLNTSICVLTINI